MRSALVLILLAHGAMCAVAQAADSPNWAIVERLRPGQTVRVQNRDQRRWTGRLSAVSAEGLLLTVDGVEHKAARSEVVRVQVRSRKMPAVIGLGFGVALGLAVGRLVSTDSAREIAAGMANGVLVCAPIGAGIGALFKSWWTVYHNQSPPTPPAAGVP
jgi:hypothetical protein